MTDNPFKEIVIWTIVLKRSNSEQTLTLINTKYSSLPNHKNIKLSPQYVASENVICAKILLDYKRRIYIWLKMHIFLFKNIYFYTSLFLVFASHVCDKNTVEKSLRLLDSFLEIPDMFQV